MWCDSWFVLKIFTFSLKSQKKCIFTTMSLHLLSWPNLEVTERKQKIKHHYLKNTTFVVVLCLHVHSVLSYRVSRCRGFACSWVFFCLVSSSWPADGLWIIVVNECGAKRRKSLISQTHVRGGILSVFGLFFHTQFCKQTLSKFN